MHIVIMGCGRVGSTIAHILEEQDHSVAIIDQGKLIAVGPVSEIADGGRQVLIGCGDTARAAAVLEARQAGSGLSVDSPGVLRVTPGQGVTVAAVNRWLVEAGVSVERLEPVRATLEERFLEITSRLEATR